MNWDGNQEKARLEDSAWTRQELHLFCVLQNVKSPYPQATEMVMELLYDYDLQKKADLEKGSNEREYIQEIICMDQNEPHSTANCKWVGG